MDHLKCRERGWRWSFPILLLVGGLAQGGSDPKVQLDKVKVERLAKRLKSINHLLENITKEDEQVVPGWRTELGRLTGEPVEGRAALLLMTEWDPLFKDDEYNRTKAAAHLARLKVLTVAELDGWQKAIKKCSEDDLGKRTLVLWISQQERLFKDGKWNEKEAGQLRNRLEATPKSCVAKWAEVTKHKAAQAAVELADMDSLYEGTSFKQGTFDRLVQEAEAKRKQ
ncbi:MAG: hypothetical protein FJ304_24640 [Planctomycetes bacterium]|nr:hypothetical protein [Planctomycetota bacterium]